MFEPLEKETWLPALVEYPRPRNWVSEMIVLRMRADSRFMLAKDRLELMVEHAVLPELYPHDREGNVLVCRLVDTNPNNMIPIEQPDRSAVFKFDGTSGRSVVFYCGKEYSYNTLHVLHIDNLVMHSQWILSYLLRGRLPMDATHQGDIRILE